MAFNPVGVVNWLEKADAAKAREEELIRSREDALLGLYLKGGKSGSATKERVGAAEAAIKFQNRIDSSGFTDEETLNYLNNIASDPYASQDVLKFIDEQATEYDRVINLRDLPTMISIIEAPTSDDDKIDLLKEFEVVDLTNKDEYYKLAERITNMTTKNGRTVFVDIGPDVIAKTDFTVREKQFEGVQKQVIRMAQVAVDSNHPEAMRIQSELNNLGSSQSALVDRATEYLFEMFITPELVQGLEEENPTAYRELSKNHLIQPYLITSDNTFPEPSQAAIEALLADPSKRAEFDLKFGPGSSDEYL